MLFLIGMPGTGKTYWGRKLAGAFRLPFIDLDELIEKTGQRSITELFEQLGENGFRRLEQASLQQILTNNDANTIVSCGGGTPVYSDNLMLMKKSGCVVYIKTDIDILSSRLKESLEKRPLLQNQDYLEDTLQDMLVIRKPVYEQADYILQSENISIVNFTEIIASCTDRP